MRSISEKTSKNSVRLSPECPEHGLPVDPRYHLYNRMYLGFFFVVLSALLFSLLLFTYRLIEADRVFLWSLFSSSSGGYYTHDILVEKNSTRQMRLADGVIPIKNELEMILDIRGYLGANESSATGKIKILFTNHVADNRMIELNGAYMKYESVEIKSTSGTLHNKINKIIIDEEMEKVQFVMDDPLPTGIFVIEIAYTPEIHPGNMGLYETAYRNAQGTWKYALVTKNEPNYMRRIAPCFDEPQLKATWSVTLIYPSNANAISNTPEMHRGTWEVDHRYAVSIFAETPIMSSYLLAFFVSDFERLEKFSKKGVLTRVFFPDEAQRKGTVGSLNVAAVLVDTLSEIFHLPYQLEKIDHVALPDFMSGAMENWGMITYRNEYLTTNLFGYDMDDQNYATVAHELTHMWFGNLVTMSWWDELFLNEGFATLYAGYMDLKKQGISGRICSRLEDLLDKDSAMLLAPINEQVDSYEDIGAKFGTEAYTKGCTILEMFWKSMGNQKWSNATTRYLQANKFTNTRYPDLLTTFEGEGSPLTSDEMSKWITQPGFPLITVHRLDASTIRLEQKRFLVYGANDNANYTYPMILHCKVDGREKKIPFKTASLDLPVPQAESFLIDNSLAGYFRVIYEANMYTTILTKYRKNEPVLDSVLNDAIAAAREGELAIDVVIPFCMRIDNCKAFVGNIKESMADTPYYDTLKNFAKTAKVPIDAPKKNNTIIENAVSTFLRQCKGDGQKPSQCFPLFTNHSSEKAREDSNRARERVYCAAAENHYELVLSKLELETDLLDALNLLAGLLCTRNESNLRKLFHRALDGHDYIIRYQDIPKIIHGISINKLVPNFVARFMFDTIAPLVENDLRDVRLLKRFLDQLKPGDQEDVKYLEKVRASFPRIARVHGKRMQRFFDRAEQLKLWKTEMAKRIADGLPDRNVMETIKLLS